MNISISSSGVFGVAEYPEVDFEIFIETDYYKTYYKFIDAESIVEDLDNFAKRLNKFPFESKSTVILDVTYPRYRLEKFKRKTPDGLTLKVYLAGAAGDIRFSVTTQDERNQMYVGFEDRVDTASLQRLSRGILSTDFTKKVNYTWDSNQTD